MTEIQYACRKFSKNSRKNLSEKKVQLIKILTFQLNSLYLKIKKILNKNLQGHLFICYLVLIHNLYFIWANYYGTTIFQCYPQLQQPKPFHLQINIDGFQN